MSFFYFSCCFWKLKNFSSTFLNDFGQGFCELGNNVFWFALVYLITYFCRLFFLTTLSSSGPLMAAASPTGWFSWPLGSGNLHIYSNLINDLMLFLFSSSFVNICRSFFAERKAVISFLSLAAISVLFRCMFLWILYSGNRNNFLILNTKGQSIFFKTEKVS